MERIKILNTVVDNLTMAETVAEADKFIAAGKPLHLMGVNADKINAMYHNETLRSIVNSCALINADGHSVVWAGKQLGTPLKERVAGVDLMQELLVLAEEKGYPVYFLGAREQVVEKTVQVVCARHPKLPVAGWRNGYFEDSQWPEIAEEVEKSGARIVFVGITSPKKEYLVRFFQDQGLTALFMGVGGSFDVISGSIPRAPLWVQKLGMEWFFRMMQEPGRLWKRYLVGNTQFVWRVCREKFRKV